MNLTISDNALQLELSGFTRLLITHGKTIIISLNHITKIRTDRPTRHWLDQHLPGISIPGKILRAGIYQSNRGKEFWYVTQDRDYLTLELKDEDYDRIILNRNQDQSLVECINQAIANNKV